MCLDTSTGEGRDSAYITSQIYTQKCGSLNYSATCSLHKTAGGMMHIPVNGFTLYLYYKFLMLKIFKN